MKPTPTGLKSGGTTTTILHEDELQRDLQSTETRKERQGDSEWAPRVLSWHASIRCKAREGRPQLDGYGGPRDSVQCGVYRVIGMQPMLIRPPALRKKDSQQPEHRKPYRRPSRLTRGVVLTAHRVRIAIAQRKNQSTSARVTSQTTHIPKNLPRARPDDPKDGDRAAVDADRGVDPTDEHAKETAEQAAARGRARAGQRVEDVLLPLGRARLRDGVAALERARVAFPSAVPVAAGRSPARGAARASRLVASRAPARGEGDARESNGWKGAGRKADAGESDAGEGNAGEGYGREGHCRDGDRRDRDRWDRDGGDGSGNGDSRDGDGGDRDARNRDTRDRNARDRDARDGNSRDGRKHGRDGWLHGGEGKASVSGAGKPGVGGSGIDGGEGREPRDADAGGKRQDGDGDARFARDGGLRREGEDGGGVVSGEGLPIGHCGRVAGDGGGGDDGREGEYGEACEACGHPGGLPGVGRSEGDWFDLEGATSLHLWN